MSDDEKQRLKYTKKENSQVEGDAHSYALDNENRSQHALDNQNLQHLKLRKKDKDELVEPKKEEQEETKHQEIAVPLVPLVAVAEPFLPEEKEALREELRTLVKNKPLFEKQEPLDIYLSARADNELVQLVERYSLVEPYQAVQNLTVEEPSMSISQEQKEKFRQFNERGMEWKKEQLENPRAESGIFCDKDTFVAVVPVPIAEKLQEMGTLEPETVEFLQEKFAHLQNLTEGKSFDQMKKLETVSPLSEAVVHANEQMKPARKNKEASERAQEQIEIIQQEIWTSEVTPRYMNYCEVYYDCDCHDAYYVIWFTEVIGYEKQWKLLEPEKKIVLDRGGRSSRDDTDRDDADR